MKINTLRRREQLDADDGRGVVRHLVQTPSGESRHAHVILLIGRGGQAVHTRRMRQRFILRGQRRCGDMRDHEARIHTRIIHQKCRQTRQSRVNQQRHTTLGQRTDFRNRQGQIIRCERHWLGVEITTGQNMHVLLVAENQRVIGHGVRLDQQRARGVVNQIQTRAHHLRLATQAVRVLHTVIFHLMRATNFTVGEQTAIQPRAGDLPRLSAHLVNTRVKRRVAAFGRINRHCADHHARLIQAFSHEQALQRERGRDLRAVNQRQAFFRRQHHRRDARLRQCGFRIDQRTVHKHLPFTHDRQRHVRQRREIARRTDRAFGRNQRRDARVKNGDHAVDHFRANAGVAAREAGDFHQ